MNFAVCDFSSKDAIQLKNDLSGFWPETEIDVFADCGLLLESIKRGRKYEMLFLDVFVLYIKMPDGSLAIDKIRKLLPKGEVVLTSVSRDYGPEAFEKNALYYLVKPYRQDQLLEVKRRFRIRHVREIEVYDSQTHQKCRVPYQKIDYIECVHNYLHIHMSAGDVVVRGSLKDFMEKLDDRFMRINRGVIVNMEKVEEMSTDSCKINGLIFMLSRRTRTENRKKYSEYMFRHHLGGDADK